MKSSADRLKLNPEGGAGPTYVVDVHDDQSPQVDLLDVAHLLPRAL